MPCFASSLLDSNRRQRALQISAGPIRQGDYYQPVRCLVLVYGKQALCTQPAVPLCVYLTLFDALLA